MGERLEELQEMNKGQVKEKDQITEAKEKLEEELEHQLEVIKELKEGEAAKYDEFMKIGEYLQQLASDYNLQGKKLAKQQKLNGDL